MSNDANLCLAGVSYPPLGKGKYDVIIFGLGFRECLLACLLLKENKRVFHFYYELSVGTHYIEETDIFMG